MRAGLYERDLEAQGIQYDTYVRHLRDVDRAILEGTTEGFVKIHVRKGKDEILGATVVGAHAGDMISEISVAMAAKMGACAPAAARHRLTRDLSRGQVSAVLRASSTRIQRKPRPSVKLATSSTGRA